VYKKYTYINAGPARAAEKAHKENDQSAFNVLHFDIRLNLRAHSERGKKFFPSVIEVHKQSSP